MRFFIINGIWCLAVVLPFGPVWGWTAASLGVPFPLFAFSLLYGVVLIAAPPWVALWLKPSLFEDRP